MLGDSIDSGAANLVAAALSTHDDLVIAGVSQGAMVVQQAQALLNSEPSIPSSTTFIIIADPNLGLVRGYQGGTVPVLHHSPQPLAETRFNTIVVINQYDGFGHSGSRPANLLAGLNAMMGMAYVHPFAQNSDLSTVPEQNITTAVNSAGGTTTTYLVPTQHLPLTQSLRGTVVPDAVVDALDTSLRPIIDAGSGTVTRAGYGTVTGAAATVDRTPRVARRSVSTQFAKATAGSGDGRRAATAR